MITAEELYYAAWIACRNYGLHPADFGIRRPRLNSATLESIRDDWRAEQTEESKRLWRSK